jgi:hypothetical protein
MRPLILLAVAAGAAVLCGCGDKPAQAPQQYAPLPKVGHSGALRGEQAPDRPTVPKK